MIRWQLSSANHRPHWLQRLALMLLGCSTHVLTAGLLTQPTTALGQDERANAVMTEIWMGGGGLVLTRRIPQDRRSARESDDDVARSMMEIGQQRYHKGDRETATWFFQWARQLTNGRIGSNGLARRRQNEVDSNFAEIFAAGDVPRNPLTDRVILNPAPRDFHPSDSAASIQEVTTDVIQDVASPAERGVPEFKIESPLSEEARHADLLPNADAFPGNSAPEKRSQQDENHQSDLDQRDVCESELVLGQRVQMIDDIGRQVAVVIPDRGHIGIGNQVNRELPAELTVEPIAIAAISFASGTVFCAVLCTVLLLIPVRLTIQRQAESQIRSRGTTSSADTRAEIPSATSVSSNSHTHTPFVKAAGEQDKANLVVEGFYHHNVGLLKRLHDQAIPSVKDAKDNCHHHIGAARA